jgi:hypothetical protein
MQSMNAPAMQPVNHLQDIYAEIARYDNETIAGLAHAFFKMTEQFKSYWIRKNRIYPSKENIISDIYRLLATVSDIVNLNFNITTKDVFMTSRSNLKATIKHDGQKWTLSISMEVVS